MTIPSALFLAIALTATDTEADELCSAIGKTSKIALQPRDRIFFDKNCVCAASDCAQRGSRKAKRLLDEQKRRRDQERREEAERLKLFQESEAGVTTAARTFSACTTSPTTTSCVAEADAFWEECYRHQTAFPGESLPCTIGDWERKLQESQATPVRSP